MLVDINKAFPGDPVRPDEVTFVHWGILPSRPAGGPHVELAKNSVVRDHRADGVDGLVTVIGVRYTTARHTAQQAVDLAFDVMGRSCRRTRSRTACRCSAAAVSIRVEVER